MGGCERKTCCFVEYETELGPPTAHRGRNNMFNVTIPSISFIFACLWRASVSKLHHPQVPDETYFLTSGDSRFERMGGGVAGV